MGVVNYCYYQHDLTAIFIFSLKSLVRASRQCGFQIDCAELLLTFSVFLAFSRRPYAPRVGPSGLWTEECKDQACSLARGWSAVAVVLCNPTFALLKKAELRSRRSGVHP